ncbi:DUF1523 family protein [Parasulfitobacter algicola]|uniref:DUF1523 family protein n=1 Tax=Parasulfitobacter algicola TaxID=2614809 RepID=A0ABX2IKM6_9RHOB|nr:DUF1523 family protein [Sulfitobacter algicola]NSX53431.1 DUF1523 family protein [Sulfitobacter algicola]
MRYIKWVFIIVFWTIVLTFLHYTLPQKDVVRIVNTYEERQDLADWTRIFWSVPDDQSETLINRDVQFIQAIRPNGKNMVYRNEDTGWNWPPYFKFDTADLYTDANDMISTKDNPVWVSVTHYGWRNRFLSVFPNAISMKQVEGPDARVIPWVSIIILIILFAIFWAIRVRWRRFRRARIDPILQDAGETWDGVDQRYTETRGKFGRWLDSWRSKPKN